jgi:hypothetical protein
LKKLIAILSAYAVDTIGVAGVALISYGSGCIYRPAGFIVAGAFLLTGALLHARS